MAEYYISQALDRLAATVAVWWAMWQTKAFILALIARWALRKAKYHDREQYR